MKSEKFTILSYSFFTSVLLHMQKNSDAQAVYTDVEPDVVLDNDSEYFFVDMDNNGFIDFLLFNWSYTTFNSYGFFETVQRLWAGPNIHDNAIVGSQFGALYVYFPYALPEATLINEDLEFQTAFFQRMAFKDIYTLGPGLVGGNWYPEMFNHYLGVRFIGSDECDHYGWIRCDVMDEGRTLVVKDFAFETKCGIGILAGDTIGDTSMVTLDELNFLNITVYSFNSTVYINLNAVEPIIDARIFDITGKKIYATKLYNKYEQIELNVQEGIYLIELISGDDKVTKTLYLN